MENDMKNETVEIIAGKRFEIRFQAMLEVIQGFLDDRQESDIHFKGNAKEILRLARKTEIIHRQDWHLA